MAHLWVEVHVVQDDGVSTCQVEPLASSACGEQERKDTPVGVVEGVDNGEAICHCRAAVQAHVGEAPLVKEPLQDVQNSCPLHNTTEQQHSSRNALAQDHCAAQQVTCPQ